MPEPFLVGPLLGFEGEISSGELLYTICFLTTSKASHCTVVVGENEIEAEAIATTPSGIFWRAVSPAKRKKASHSCRYQIKTNGSAIPDRWGRDVWTFWVPGASEQPRIAYASCNGFSDPDAIAKLGEPYRMWKVLWESHEKEPFTLFIMGGDQIYADEIWQSKTRVPTIVEWIALPRAERIVKQVSKKTKGELDRFYESLYIRHWAHENMGNVLASIPSIMMWDDHDIFDGWGSYPSEMQTCPHYQAIFEAARKYFELFQLRSTKNRTLLNSHNNHYSFGFQFGNYAVLGLDNRTGRNESAIMGDENWSDIKKFLKKRGKVETLFILSAIPVVYRDFRVIEHVYDATPWEEELTDDIRDHWRSSYHEGERMKLIMSLLDFQSLGKLSEVRRVILSGDVHVGCFGLIAGPGVEGRERLIHQVVSSAIVHPPPTWLQWQGVLAGSNALPETLEAGSIRTELLKPYGSEQFIRSRNFVWFKEGTDRKLWVNWVCEDNTRAEYPIVYSS